MKIFIKILLTFICTGLGFFGSILFFNGMGYRFLAMLIGSGAPLLMSQPYFLISIHAGFALLSFILSAQIIFNRYSIVLCKLLPYVYYLLAFSLIMLKSRGMQGFNINPLELINQIIISPATVIFNLMIFIPFGIHLHMKDFKFINALLIAVVSILTCELLQFVLHLGICDVIDVALNLFGFIFGWYIYDFIRSKGISLEQYSNKFYRLRF